MTDTVPVAGMENTAFAMTEVNYPSGENERYQLPLTFVPVERGNLADELFYRHAIARVELDGLEGFLIDASADETFRSRLLDLILHRETWSGAAGKITADAGKMLENSCLSTAGEEPPASHLMGLEQSNTSIRYGEQLCLKLYRKIDSGMAPEIEISRVLTDQTEYRNIPVYLGSFDYGKATGSAVRSAFSRISFRMNPTAGS